jgi:hypothetical protein
MEMLTVTPVTLPTIRSPTRSPTTSACRRLPAALAPLGDGGAFGAEGGVFAVAGVEPGFVGQLVEELVLDVVDQRGEAVRILLRVPDTTGEA